MTSPKEAGVLVYFADFFGVTPQTLADYGAFNISLISDMPLFVDPFLLFASDNPQYQVLHEQMINYLRFLVKQAEDPDLSPGLIKGWFQFSEVKENWMGYAKWGNRGSGLGPQFAYDLFQNLRLVFHDFGDEKITQGSHLEKLCLVTEGVGRDNISDFTVCLIKEFLLEYTERFAKDYLSDEQTATFSVSKSRFNYKLKIWEPRSFRLPKNGSEFILLTPRDLLTRTNTWINRPDLFANFETLAESLPDDVLRAQLNNHFRSQLVFPKESTEREKTEIRNLAIKETIRRYPQIIEYYIKERESDGGEAVTRSFGEVEETEDFFVRQTGDFIAKVLAPSGFYDLEKNSYEAALARARFLKQIVENQDGYRILYGPTGTPIKHESDLHILFKLTWFGSTFDANAEVNNGRGPVDFKVSKGSADKSLVDFKLASNSHLERNLKKQMTIYEDANQTRLSIWVIFCCSSSEQLKVQRILADLGLSKAEHIVVVDARADNKASASTVR